MQEEKLIASLKLKVSCLERSMKSELAKQKANRLTTTIEVLQELLLLQEEQPEQTERAIIENNWDENNRRDILNLCFQLSQKHAPTEDFSHAVSPISCDDVTTKTENTSVDQQTSQSIESKQSNNKPKTKGKKQPKDKKAAASEDIEYRTLYQSIITDAQLPFKYIAVRCIEKTMLNSKVVRLRLRIEDESIPFIYRGGQYIHLTRATDGLTRRYSLASCPGEECDGRTLEIQVRVVANGLMTNWLVNTDEYVDDNSDTHHLLISGPDGTGYYREPPLVDYGLPFLYDGHDDTSLTASKAKSPHRIIMVGVGTGLSPLWAIMREALLIHQNRNSHIHLFHLNLSMDTAYYVQELRAYESKFNNFHYYPCVKLENGDIENAYPEHNYAITNNRVYVLTKGATFQTVTNHLFDNQYDNSDIYLCGLDKRMQNVERDLISMGADPRRIFRDRFWK